MSQIFCFYSLYFLLPPQNKMWALYSIPSHSLEQLVHLLNLISLPSIHLPMDIFKPLVLSLFPSRSIFSFKFIFSRFAYVPLLTNYAKLYSLLSGYFSTMSDSQHFYWFPGYQSLKEENKSSSSYLKTLTVGPCLL